MPTIAAKHIPDSDNVKFPVVKEIAAPPSPRTSIADATITFFVFPKSV